MRKRQSKSKIQKYAKPALRLTYQLMEHLILCGASTMLEILLTPPRYGQGIAATFREAEIRAAECPHDFSWYAPSTLSSTLSRLKQKGLIKRKGPPKKAVWLITQSGKQHFVRMPRSRGYTRLPKDGELRLVVYDIPESERTKRDLLRLRLYVCGYAPLQKSVWLGERPLPQELWEELKERDIYRYIHVVSLTGLKKNEKETA